MSIFLGGPPGCGLIVFIPYLAILTAHSPGRTPAESPRGPMQRDANSGRPVWVRLSRAHSISSTLRKY